ncbi:hypothetical protein CHUAL_009983 [Chamberlinius hualienensis]
MEDLPLSPTRGKEVVTTEDAKDFSNHGQDIRSISNQSEPKGPLTYSEVEKTRTTKKVVHFGQNKHPPRQPPTKRTNAKSKSSKGPTDFWYKRLCHGYEDDGNDNSSVSGSEDNEPNIIPFSSAEPYSDDSETDDTLGSVDLRGVNLPPIEKNFETAVEPVSSTSKGITGRGIWGGRLHHNTNRDIGLALRPQKFKRCITCSPHLLTRSKKIIHYEPAGELYSQLRSLEEIECCCRNFGYIFDPTSFNFQLPSSPPNTEGDVTDDESYELDLSQLYSTPER